jgi:hypothetical protein
MHLKQRLAALTLAGALMVSTVASIAAASPTQVAGNGARGVVAAAVAALQNVNATNNTVDVAIVQLNNSLNNLTALNNVLNNSPIANNNNILQGITIQNIDVAIANGSLNQLAQNALQNANIAIGQVVGIAVLSGGDLLVFVR